jgi:hypothetical protein
LELVRRSVLSEARYAGLKRPKVYATEMSDTMHSGEKSSAAPLHNAKADSAFIPSLKHRAIPALS